jgi:predicted RND superfamily exporter protein
MIPVPRVAAWVVLSIVLSVIDLVGFMHWWDVTISGVSTIYILISVGLAVDYSAHVAHMFVVSTGTAPERAKKSLERIGPSVFNGVMSTLLAVVIIGFSKSYVFRVFFKALFLTVVIGGAHGLVFLPTMLSIFGGNKLEGDSEWGPKRKRKSLQKVDDMFKQEEPTDQKVLEETANSSDKSSNSDVDVEL